MINIRFLVCTGLSCFYFHTSNAQEVQPNDSLRTTSIDQLVITGSSNPKKKIESSTAISTFNAVEIQRQNPISSAALLQRVPGFAVETSGGEVGNKNNLNPYILKNVYLSYYKVFNLFNEVFYIILSCLPRY